MRKVLAVDRDLAAMRQVQEAAARLNLAREGNLFPLFNKHGNKR
jgi:hypothetical protein